MGSFPDGDLKYVPTICEIIHLAWLVIKLVLFMLFCVHIVIFLHHLAGHLKSKILICTVVVMFASTALLCYFSYVSMHSMEGLTHKGAL